MQVSSAERFMGVSENRHLGQTLLYQQPHTNNPPTPPPPFLLCTHTYPAFPFLHNCSHSSLTAVRTIRTDGRRLSRLWICLVNGGKKIEKRNWREDDISSVLWWLQVLFTPLWSDLNCCFQFYFFFFFFSFLWLNIWTEWISQPCMQI